jgi:hypothetical protein
MEEGISPVNLFLLKYLEIKSENKSLSFAINSEHCYSTYNFRKSTRLPIGDGISPVNSLSSSNLVNKK